MDERQSALAYGRAYELFSEVYRHGLTDELAEMLGIVQENAESHYGAEHYQLFVHQVFPYEAIFLDDDGLLGGAITEKVAAFYQRIGYVADSDESPDHISTQLDAMAYLSYAELDAVEDGVMHQVQRLRQLQRQFLDTHLLRWMPLFVMAVQQQEATIYTELVQQSFELVCSHRGQLGEDLMATSDVFSLSAVPDLLNNEKTSLRDIARYLLTPSHTGFFLSSYDIRRMGARFRVPHGFGKRQQILTNLLRTASGYDVFPELIAEFRGMAAQASTQFEVMDNLPESIRSVWMARLSSTGEMLSQIEQMARDKAIIMDDELADMAVASGETSAGCSVEKDVLDDSSC